MNELVRDASRTGKVEKLREETVQPPDLRAYDLGPLAKARVRLGIDLEFAEVTLEEVKL
jgi:hypothetical protein